MKSTECLLKTITFSRKGLKLEEVVRLIYFNKEAFEFDECLHSIITYLRKHSKHIIYIGYDSQPDNIRVKLVIPLS